MNLPLLIPCLAVLVLSPAIALDPEIGVAGMPDALVMAQKRAPQVELFGFPAMPDVCALDSLERPDEVASHDATAKEKSIVKAAKAERRRRADTDERFGMLMLLLHMLQDAQ